jgi:inosine-uridine nucleoside N-ribohydrolase
MATSILLDCDPGHDDAMAILLALASPELELLGVTTVAGNQTLAKTTANALRVLDFVAREDVPVAAGGIGPWSGTHTSPATCTEKAVSTARTSPSRSGGS